MNCENCKHWHRLESGELYHPKADTVQVEESGKIETGRCQRYPPQVSDEGLRRVGKVPLYERVHCQLLHGMIKSATIFPLTYDYDTCGEFNPNLKAITK